MKKLSIITIICICSLLLISCDDDDWAPYERYTDEVNITIESNIFSMEECYPELLEISKKYAKDSKLTHAEYHFSKEEDDYAVFTMYKGYQKKSGAGYGINCFIYVNTETNKVYKIVYENGISKRVSHYTSELEMMEKDAKDLYNSAIENLSDEKYNSMETVEVIYYWDAVIVHACDYDNMILYKKIYELQ